MKQDQTQSQLAWDTVPADSTHMASMSEDEKSTACAVHYLKLITRTKDIYFPVGFSFIFGTVDPSFFKNLQQGPNTGQFLGIHNEPSHLHLADIVIWYNSPRQVSWSCQSTLLLSDTWADNRASFHYSSIGQSVKP